MSWLEFIAQMTSALGWPIVALITIIFLGPEIKAAAKFLVNRIGDNAHLKAPGLAIDFKQEMKELAEATEELKDEAPKALTRVGPEDIVLPRETADQRFSKYQDLAALDPRAAILLPFADLEALIRQEFQKRYPQANPTLGFKRIIGTLEDEGVLDPDISGSLKELSDLRNRVAHGQAELDADVANYYVQSVGNVLGYLLLSGFFKEQSPKELDKTT